MEDAADHVAANAPRVNTAFYHGGEPIRVIRPFLEGEEKKPYFLAMTAAGQSALNVRGLDTVVIDDTRFSNVIERGRNVLTQEHLGANEILQMAGRVQPANQQRRRDVVRQVADDAHAGRQAREVEFERIGAMDGQRWELLLKARGEIAIDLDRLDHAGGGDERRGEHPFAGANLHEVIGLLRRDRVQDLLQHASLVQEVLAETLTRAMRARLQA